MATNDTTKTADEQALGTSEQALREARIAKAKRLRERNQNPFSNDLDPRALQPIGTVRAAYESAKQDGGYNAEQVTALSQGLAWRDGAQVAGRVVAARSFGKASFLRLRDWSGEIQVFCRKNVLGDNYAALQDIDVADHILAAGPVMVTKTGELSIDATNLRLLTKAFRPLPEKWHGLTDVEVRYRRRYLDLISNEDVRHVFRARAVIVRALRRYLDTRGFLEVETPTMNPLVGGAAARPFITHHNTLDMQLYMRIAPELYLKRLVVGGFERVYEIGRCYRNEGISTRHNPEFTMLEFYMGYATYNTLMDMTEDMLRFVDDELRREMPEQHQAWASERSFSFDGPFERRTMHELLRYRMQPEVERLLSEEVGADLNKFRKLRLDASMFELSNQQAAEQLEQVFIRGQADDSPLPAATRKQLKACDNHGERVFLLYELLVEPNLTRLFRRPDGKSVPVFVTDHPVETSPLARRQSPPGDPRLVDRYELFVHGKELCNAFSELNDPEDQAERFREQVAKKARGAEETMDYDEDYIRALEHGLPPTAGFGMGIDRLVMMLTAKDSIREVILFPLLRPEQ